MTIHILPADVAAKIAAGEVVERPANAAKELIENSLDAGATDIRVEVREGGRRLLRVTDNGHGMSADETGLAFLRHATSKLSTAEDLEHIRTFGFRGEALYSIAAVSQVTLITRHQSEDLGTQLRLEGGEIVRQARAGAPVGAMISIEHLFYNVPARQKFLRSAATEAGAIGAVVQHYALAYPECRFAFINEGRLVFQSNGSGDLFDVVSKVYSLEEAKQMVKLGATAAQREPSTPANLRDEVDFMQATSPVSAAAEPGASTAAPIRVTGYASLPSLTRANRSGIDLFVNRRYIEDRSLTHAIVQAYHTLLQVGRYPMAVVMVDLDPSLVDVNVHPQKTQVRFADERRVFAAVQKAVRRAVIDQVGVADMELDEQGVLRPALSGSTPLPAPQWATGWAERRNAILNAGQHEMEFFLPPSRPAPPVAVRGAVDSSADVDPFGDRAAPPAPPSPSAVETAAASPLQPRTPQLPPLRVVGQVGAMYIVAEGPEGMVLIDQHAAHERILYEQFMGQRFGLDNGGVVRQQLLEPLTLHIGGEIAGMVANHLQQLVHVGYEIEPFGGDTFLVRAVPSVLANDDPLRTLEDIAASLADRRNLVGEEFEARLVKMVCKRAAIKGGQLLSDIEMQELVRQLEECQSPRTCPHGRPTMIHLSAGELEKAFGRI